LTIIEGQGKTKRIDAIWLDLTSNVLFQAVLSQITSALRNADIAFTTAVRIEKKNTLIVKPQKKIFALFVL
jgi:hypothetical protein